jgi:hypothetical protein
MNPSKRFDEVFGEIRTSEGVCPVTGIVGSIIKASSNGVAYLARLGLRRTIFLFDLTELKWLYEDNGARGYGLVLDRMIDAQVEAGERLSLSLEEQDRLEDAHFLRNLRKSHGAA